MNTKLGIAIGISVAALLFIGLPQAKSNLANQSFEVNSGGTLYLDSDSGSVKVEPHGKNTVDISVQKKGNKADEFTVSYSQDGNDVRVIGDRENNYFGGSLSVKFIVKVPENYNVDLKTGGGSIDLADLSGKVDARTSGGSIKLGRIEGDVDAKTSGGSIKVEEVLGNIDAHTSGGSVSATLSQQPTKDCKLSTSGGSVTAYMSPSIAVNVNASTSGGRVRSEFDVNGSVKKTRIKGAINGGGPELYLRTSGGSVNIKKI